MNFETEQLIQLASGLEPEQFPFLSLSHNNQHGWPRILAWEPYDTYNYKGDLGHLDSFFKANKGRIIAGFIGYDTGMKQLDLVPVNKSILGIPGAWFAAYDKYAVINNGNIDIIGGKNLKPRVRSNGKTSAIEFQALTNRMSYNKSIDTIKDHIINGDIYQANLTHFLQANWFGNHWNLYRIIYEKNPVDFSACILHPDFSIYSFSPEKFITSKDRIIHTEPIKGTRPRGNTEKSDAMERNILLSSQKEAAELNMITDLLRNDLGKISNVGSVELIRHRETMALSYVWHTYSTIRSELADDLSLINGIISMLPGGSITGCPKKRAVQIISELEEFNRNLYTGTIGFQLPNGDSYWNIAIRTLLQENDKLFLGVGGGITLDSNAEDEYNETLAKAKSFMEILA